MSKMLSKTEKSDRLHQLGYRVALKGAAILVKSPAGNIYRIDAEAKTCSCPASVECAHLLGLVGLLQDTAASIDDTGPECRLAANAYSEEGLRRRALVLALQDRAHEVMVMFEGREREEARAAA